MVNLYAYQSFHILPEFFSGKRFMQWAPDLHEISCAGGFWHKNTVKVL